MSDIPVLALSIFAGAFLGALFFGGLWWTVQKGTVFERPALWFLGSLLLRTGMVVTGFYVVSHGHWSRLAACLVGFLIARVVVLKRLTRPPAKERMRWEKETSHAAQSR